MVRLNRMGTGHETIIEGRYTHASRRGALRPRLRAHPSVFHEPGQARRIFPV